MKLLTEYCGDALVGWYWCEKFDGVRLHWTGEAFVTRTGNVPPTPAWAAASMPARIAVDCELWAGRGRFGHALSAVQTGDWSGCKVVAFDAVSEEPICERVDKLRKAVSGDVVVPEYRRVKDADGHLDEIVGLGGEGIVLCDPVSGYRHGRTATCQKLKPRHETDATVIGVNLRKDGRPSSVTVFIGSVRQKVLNHVADVSRGDVVQIAHDGMTGGGGLRNAVVDRVKQPDGWRGQIREAMVGSVSDLSRVSGVSRPKLSRFLSGKSDLSGKNIERLITAMGGRIVFD